MRMVLGRPLAAFYSARALAPFVFSSSCEQQSVTAFAQDFIPDEADIPSGSSVGELKNMLSGKMALDVKSFHLADYRRFEFALRFLPHMEFHRGFVDKTLGQPELWTTSDPRGEMIDNTQKFGGMMQSLTELNPEELREALHKMTSDLEQADFLERNAKQQFSHSAVSERIRLFHHICLGWNMYANIGHMEPRDPRFFTAFAENTLDYLYGQSTKLPKGYGLEPYDTRAIRERAHSFDLQGVFDRTDSFRCWLKRVASPNPVLAPHEELRIHI